MTIAVTAASGQLGRLVIADLLERGVPAADIRAVVRTPEKVADLAEQGVQVVAGDYTDAEGLAKALAGVDKWLFISSSGPNEARWEQHRTAITAAVAAAVPHVVYTSIPRADVNAINFAWVHRDTEKAIREAGLTFTFLRNNWYWENVTANLAGAIEHGALIGSAAEGRVGFAARADYAAAAAAVLTTDGHEGEVYELTGDTTTTYHEIAAEVARQTGKPVVYSSLPQADYQAALEGFGLPGFLAEMLAEADTRIAEGALQDTTETLATLIGRPTTTLEQAVAAGLAG